jgi:hypothetical protein
MNRLRTQDGHKSLIIVGRVLVTTSQDAGSVFGKKNVIGLLTYTNPQE